VHRLLKATSKKARQLCDEKSAPPDKILATPMKQCDEKKFCFRGVESLKD